VVFLCSEEYTHFSVIPFTVRIEMWWMFRRKQSEKRVFSHCMWKHYFLLCIQTPLSWRMPGCRGTDFILASCRAVVCASPRSNGSEMVSASSSSSDHFTLQWQWVQCDGGGKPLFLNAYAMLFPISETTSSVGLCSACDNVLPSWVTRVVKKWLWKWWIWGWVSGRTCNESMNTEHTS